MIDHGAPPVKTRRYDASRRRAAEQARRAAVIEAAGRLLLDDGYAATTIAAIARTARVSPETVYRMFGGKPGLVRALCDEALLGAGTEPAERRSDLLRETAGSAAELVRGWAALIAEVSPRISPLHLLVLAGAAADPGLTELLHELEDDRWKRMQDNARALLAAGGVRPELGEAEVTDVLWLYTAPEWYQRLVLDRGWSVATYAEFVGDAIAAALLVRP
jgi:AcrR family transcriptional regulator